jgi:ArsR family transcriptional regulator
MRARTPWSSAGVRLSDRPAAMRASSIANSCSASRSSATVRVGSGQALARRLLITSGSLRCPVVSAISILVNMPPLSTLVNIETGRYSTGMSRLIDPDVRLLAALADPVRLEIVRELAGSSETSACDLTSCCTVRQPTVSHHLRVLREAGVVVSDRRGSNIYYRTAPDLLERLRTIAQGVTPGGLGPAVGLTPRGATAGARSRVTRGGMPV